MLPSPIRLAVIDYMHSQMDGGWPFTFFFQGCVVHEGGQMFLLLTLGLQE